MSRNFSLQNTNTKCIVDIVYEIKYNFILCFNNLIKKYKILKYENESEVILEHIINLLGSNRLFNITTLQFVSDLKNQIFSNSIIRDFYLELLETFSLNTLIINEANTRGIELVINTLVDGNKYCQPTNETIEQLLPIRIPSNKNIETYKNNPWLVITYLLTTEFINTDIGLEITTKLPLKSKNNRPVEPNLNK